MFEPRAFLKHLEPDTPKAIALTETAQSVLATRYLKKSKGGKISETPDEMLYRVARTVAKTEKQYGGDVSLLSDLFHCLMTRREFLPNSPTLINAGKHHGQLSACFVIPVGDSMEEIFEAVKQMALVQKTGGGTGFSFSSLRPARDPVASTHGISSGPLSFIEVFNMATETIKQGGARRGANMAVLDVHHPDIIAFVTAKMNPQALNNFNVSVAVSDAFMAAAQSTPPKPYDLVNPRTKKPVSTRDAAKILTLISHLAWENGEPGILFIDRINEQNPTPHLGRIDATNPCGELPLLPHESCNLGSINLERFVLTDGPADPIAPDCAPAGRPPRDHWAVDWFRLQKTVWAAVRFLDNVIDASHFPLPQIEQATRRTRKIGLGVMGFADALIRLGVSYDSPLAVAWAERFMSTIARESKRASAHLAATRGPFPEFEKSRLATQNHSPQRNATTNTVAPTGTISIIAGCSSGIEPLFALAYKRNILEGRQFWEVHPLLGELARTHDLDFSGIDPSSLQNAEKDDLSEQLEQRFPASLKKNLITAHQIPPAQHVRIQAAFQKHVDNSVSKTINLPAFAPPEKVVETIGQAYALGVKGLTFYRDRSRKKQAIEHHPGPARRPAAHAQESDPAVDARGPQAPAGGPPCPDCGSKTYRGRQCLACPQCGWSRCT